ncbi:hypothetical protein E2320_016577 [Naja naja]|nr:hypothetical protein E2320_016577 [Naja naja]
MAASGPPNLFVGEMGARELPNLHLPGSRVEQTGGVTWQKDTAGNWTRLEGSAAHSETTSRGAEAQPVTTLWVTNPSKTAGNQQHLHRELLFTHRKPEPSIKARAAPGSRASEPAPGGDREWLETIPLSRSFCAGSRDGNSINSRKQQEILVREKLRRTQQQRDPSPQQASPSLISVPFPHLHHPNRKPSQFPVKHPPVAPQAVASHPQSSLKDSSFTSVPSKHSLANNT